MFLCCLLLYFLLCFWSYCVFFFLLSYIVHCNSALGPRFCANKIISYIISYQIKQQRGRWTVVQRHPPEFATEWRIQRVKHHHYFHHGRPSSSTKSKRGHERVDIQKAKKAKKIWNSRRLDEVGSWYSDMVKRCTRLKTFFFLFTMILDDWWSEFSPKTCLSIFYFHDEYILHTARYSLIFLNE